MAWTQSDIDTIKKAMATGVRRVRYSGEKEVTYRSFSEMRDTLAVMEAEVTPPTTPGVRRYVTKSGW